jgi:hypothetical protein
MVLAKPDVPTTFHHPTYDVGGKPGAAQPVMLLRDSPLRAMRYLASTKAWRIEPIVHPLSWPGSGRQFNSTFGGAVSRKS